jgi:hypothetical protein
MARRSAGSPLDLSREETWAIRVELVLQDGENEKVRAGLREIAGARRVGIDSGTGSISVPMVGVVLRLEAADVGTAVARGVTAAIEAVGLPIERLYGVTAIRTVIVPEELDDDVPGLVD